MNLDEIKVTLEKIHNLERKILLMVEMTDSLLTIRTRLRASMKPVNGKRVKLKRARYPKAAAFPITKCYGMYIDWI